MIFFIHFIISIFLLFYNVYNLKINLTSPELQYMQWAPIITLSCPCVGTDLRSMSNVVDAYVVDVDIEV